MPYRSKPGFKRCGGPLHNGQQLPLDHFWVFKKGRRAGKPLSQCIDCERYYRYGEEYVDKGYVLQSRVWFIFEELQRRLGKMETCRRLNLSMNFWMRAHKRRRILKKTVRLAIQVLQEARKNNEVRHKKSIRHGSALRGRKEKTPTHRLDYYKSQGDADNEYKRVRARRLTDDQA